MSAEPQSTAVPGETAQPAAEARRRTRRQSGPERRAAILGAAALLFAEEGFGASTRALAARLGISQAALYKHFPSKDAIVAALLDSRLARRTRLDWVAGLAEDGRPLEQRLGTLYAAFVNGIDATGQRLFVRAGLDGYGAPGRRGAVLTAQILEPVIAALRREAGLPALDERPMRHGERELAMALHGGVVFLAIRKHVYRMPMPDDLGEPARLQVRLWLPGALAELARLHTEPGADVPQLAPRRDT